jgi:L-2-hydroxycarboxylate dehydrogenase (NAD+)
LPGEPEAKAAALSAKHGGLIFSAAEIDALDEIGKEAGVKLDRSQLKAID